MAVNDEPGGAYRRLMAATVYQALQDLTNKDCIKALDAFLWLTDPGGGPAWLDALDMEINENDIMNLIAGGLDHAKKYNRGRFTACSDKEPDPLPGYKI